MGSLTNRPQLRLLLVAPLLLMCAISAGCRERNWPLWEAYSARFIDQQGRVYESAEDHQRTTSEGQSYALFFSLVANNRAGFDRILNWTQVNLAGGNMQHQLPAWLWQKDTEKPGKILDSNSAADADVWMAYTLIEAGRLWHHSPYTTLGRAMLVLIAQREVVTLPGFGSMLLPGPSGFQHGTTYTLNPSYLPVFLFTRFADVNPSGPWMRIAANVPKLLEQSARHGFAMDWVDYVPGDGFYPSAVLHSTVNEPEDSAGGSYDAIRVYLWAGMIDSQSPVRWRILNAIPSMADWLARHNAPPERVSQQGIPFDKEAPIGFSAAVLPYLRGYPKLAKIEAAQLIRLAAQRNAANGLYGKPPAYYDQNLALFSTGFLDGHFRFGRQGELNVEWKLR